MEITDLELYRPHIDQFDLTEEQKLELVNTIVHITEMVLDKKFQLIEKKIVTKSEEGQKS